VKNRAMVHGDDKPVKKRVLFLCTANRCRSQLAEALVNRDLGDRFEAFSAGTNPKTPHPLALKVLAEIGIDHAAARSKHLREFDGQTFDYVVTLCDEANESCPVFLGGTTRIHIGVENPDDAAGSEEERMIVFRRVRDWLREHVEARLCQEEKNRK